MNARSLNDLKKEEEEGRSGGDEFFAGGTGRGGSGMAVLGPPGGNRNGSGASGLPLGGLMDGVVRNAMNPGDMLDGASAPGPRVTLYRNGFQVDDGPLRRIDAPESEEFLRSLLNGRVPAELGNANLDVSLVDKRGEDYEEPPPPAYVAFSGEGNSLSSGAGTNEGGEGVFTIDDVPDGTPTVDAAAPTTLLQVRLSSGKKMKMKLNQKSTVQDILRLIKAEGSTEAGRTFTLRAGFPPKTITDISQSISDAGLCGESISQT